MSQVIVTKDNLSSKREKSASQEHRITTDDGIRKWRRNDITGSDPVARLLGLAALPILGLWGLLCGVMAFIVTVVNYVFKGLGRLIGGRKNLITGD